MSSSMAATHSSRTTSAARTQCRQHGIHYVDVGTSGGVWGLERGYCLMIGGEKPVVDMLDPIFETLAPGYGRWRARPAAPNMMSERSAATSTPVRPARAISSRWSTTASNTA